jgi:hypothetical protein
MDAFNFDDDPVDDASQAFLFDAGEIDEPTEHDRLPSARALRMQARRHMLRVEREQRLQELLGAAPKAGESIHVISSAKFDFWTWVPVMIDWLGAVDHLYCSTWTLSRPNAKELLALWDAKKITSPRVNILTGTYFKRRESAVYAYLVDGLSRRGGHYRAFQNHAKVLLLANVRKKTWLTIEGSANLTSNPRLEQAVITNDRKLHDFHLAWMDEMLARTPQDDEV